MRSARVPAFLILVLSFVALLPAAAAAQSPGRNATSADGYQVVVTADPNDAFSRVLPLGSPFGGRNTDDGSGGDALGDSLVPQGGTCGGSAVQTSTWVVTYTGFSGPAQTAFQCAIDILSRRVVSTVPIVVKANWAALGANVLGSAGPQYVVREFTGGTPSTYYAAAVANALAGVDIFPDAGCGISGGCHDINASFSSNFANWYFGTDGNTPAGNYDFITVVLHEMIHGVGFLGSFRVQTGQYRWGSNESPPRPYVFDTKVQNGTGQSLINTALFANPSAALGTQLTSNNVFFSGTNTNAANGATPAKLYAPAAWSGGSSISHLDDATFDGSINALMTHAVGTAEANHEIGPVVRGVLLDGGWDLADFSLSFDSSPANGAPGVLSPQPSVSVRGNNGAVLTSDNATSVTIALTGAGTITCTGGNTKTVVSGVASFSGCTIAAAGTYQLQATATAVLPLAPVLSSQFTLQAPSYHLAFTQEPGGGQAGNALGVQPTVAVKDASNVTNAADNTTVVTLALQGGAGTLSCTGGLSKTVASGVAAFSGCSVSAPGTFTLLATAVPATTTQIQSASFQVTTPPPPIGVHQLAAVGLGAEVAVFGRNDAGAIWYRETSGGSFGAWSLLGGSAAGRPLAIEYAGDLYVFSRGTGNDLKYWVRSGGTWSEQSLGGVISGDVTAAVDGAGRLVVAAIGPGGAPWSIQRSGGAWGSWQALGGTLARTPVIFEHGGDVYLVGSAGNDQLWTRTWQSAGAAWTAWQQLDGQLASNLETAKVASGTYLFGVNSVGVTWFRQISGGVWGAWASFGGTLSSTPAAASTGSLVAFAGTNSIGAGWSQRANPAWSGWELLGGVLGTDFELAGTSSAIYAFALSPDGALWYRLLSGGSWGPWGALGGILAIE